MSRFGPLLVRLLVTLLAATAAAIVGWQLWSYYLASPWTRDGRVRADVVQVAPDVSGLVTQVLVHDNQKVAKGDLLFTIDRERFALALQQAQATVASRRAAMEQSARDAERYEKLTTAAVSESQREQARSQALIAASDYDQSVATQAVAALNLARAEVRASVNGQVTNLGLQVGDYVNAGRPVFALIDSDSFRVEGYFEETKLARIHPGDPVTIRLLGVDVPLTGHVDSIAAGIFDRDRTDSADLLANVNPTFSWVRLAQRVPVRVALDPLPAGVTLVAGRTATVIVRPGS